MGAAAAARFLRALGGADRRTRRGVQSALAAAQASLQAGSFDAALPGSWPRRRAERWMNSSRVDLLRGQVALALSGSDAVLLLRAAGRLEPFDLDLARETYLIAWGATVSDLEGGHPRRISCAIRALPPPTSPPRPLDLLLDGLALLTLEGRAARGCSKQRSAS